MPTHPDTLDDLEQELLEIATAPAATPDLLDEIWKQASGPKQVWKPVANIALIYQQRCATCSHSHEFFMGWYTEQRHASDRFVRRLVQGRSPGLPALVERQSHGLVEYCPDCVEAQILIDNAAAKEG